MNLRLAKAAETAVKTGAFEIRAGYCLRFCREVDAVVEGGLYERLFRGDGTARDATAARAGHRFLARGLAFLRSELKAHGGLQPGDMPVKTQVAHNRWGDFSGHIGVVCADGRRIAENSSTTKGRVRGALGFRTLTQFGEFDIVIRLPEFGKQSVSPDVKQTSKRPVSATTAKSQEASIASGEIEVFTFNHIAMPYAYFDEGRIVVPLVDFLHAFGYETHVEGVTSRGGNIQGWKAQS